MKETVTPSTTTAKANINRKVAPPIKDAVDFDLRLKPYEKYALDNGVEVYAVNAGAEEVLQIEWVFFAGNWYEQQNLIAATTNFLLRNGTSKRTAYQLNEHFEYYGSYLNRSCYNETALLNLHCLTRHLEVLLPVVEEILSDSVFTEEELKLYKKTNKQRLEVNLKKCEFVANRLIDVYLYGDQHPYGKYTSGPAFDAVAREQVIEFYKQFYLNGRCMIFVAGKLPDNLLPLLNKHFGQLPFNKMALPSYTHDLHPATEKHFRVSNDPKGVQGAIRIATPFPNRHHPDFLKVQVLNNLFGGFFGSRLMSNIREDKGYTYGIHSFLQNHLHNSAWVVSTEAGRDVCEATISEVYNEMKVLREELVDEEELMLVRNYMMGTILGDLDGPFHIIAKWKNIILNQLPPNFFYDSIHVIKNVTAEELRELARKYLKPENFYELVVI